MDAQKDRAKPGFLLLAAIAGLIAMVVWIGESAWRKLRQQTLLSDRWRSRSHEHAHWITTACRASPVTRSAPPERLRTRYHHTPLAMLPEVN